MHGRSVSRILSPSFAPCGASEDGRPSIWDRSCLRTRARYQICACTGQGLPRRRSHGCPGRALTSVVSPLPRSRRNPRPKPRRHSHRDVVRGEGCGGLLSVALSLGFAIRVLSRYPRECSIDFARPPLAAVHDSTTLARRRVFGLSSTRVNARRPSDRPCVPKDHRNVAWQTPIVNGRSFTFPPYFRRNTAKRKPDVNARPVFREGSLLLGLIPILIIVIITPVFEMIVDPLELLGDVAEPGNDDQKNDDAKNTYYYHWSPPFRLETGEVSHKSRVLSTLRPCPPSLAMTA